MLGFILNQASLRELASKDQAFDQFTAQLSTAEMEMQRLRSTGDNSTDSLRRITAMFHEKEHEIAGLQEELLVKEAMIDGLKKQTVRTDGRLLELLNRITANDALVADLSGQLRETELRIGTVDGLMAREEAQKALEVSLDAKIAHLHQREQDIRVMETKLAGFVTDQLELANRESESVRRAFDLDLKVWFLSVPIQFPIHIVSMNKEAQKRFNFVRNVNLFTFSFKTRQLWVEYQFVHIFVQNPSTFGWNIILFTFSFKTRQLWVEHHFVHIFVQTRQLLGGIFINLRRKKKPAARSTLTQCLNILVKFWTVGC